MSTQDFSSDFLTPEYPVMRAYYHDYESRFQFLMSAANCGKSRLTLQKCLNIPANLCELKDWADYGRCRLARGMIIRESAKSIADNLIPLMREAFPPAIRLDETEGFTKPKLCFYRVNPKTGEKEKHIIVFTLVGLSDQDAHNRHRGGNYDFILINEVEKLANRGEAVRFLFSRVNRNITQSSHSIIFGDFNPVPASHWIWSWIPIPEDGEIDKPEHKYGFAKDKTVHVGGGQTQRRRLYHCGNQLARAQAGEALANPVAPPSYYLGLVDGSNENDRRKNLEGKIPLSDHAHLVYPSFSKEHCVPDLKFQPGLAVYAGADTDGQGAIVLAQIQGRRIVVPENGVIYADGMYAGQMGEKLAQLVRDDPALRTCPPMGLWGDPAGADMKYGDGNSYIYHLNKVLTDNHLGNWHFAPTPFIHGRKENSGQGRASYVEPMLGNWLSPADDTEGKPSPFVVVSDKRLQEALSEYHYKVSWTQEGTEVTNQPDKDKYSGPAEAFAYLLAGLKSTLFQDMKTANVDRSIPSITHSGPPRRVISDENMQDPNNPVIFTNVKPDAPIPASTWEVQQPRIGGITNL